MGDEPDSWVLARRPTHRQRDVLPTAFPAPRPERFAARPAGPADARAPWTRWSHVDGVRGIAALNVLLVHLYLTVYPVDPGPLPFLRYGHFRTAVFITVSGFSLAMSPSRAGWRLPGGVLRFAARRAWRVLPPYWVAWALSGLAAATVLSARTGTHWDQALPLTPRDAATTFLLLQDVRVTYAGNHVFWTMAIEVHLYLLFPLLLLAARRGGARGLLLAGLGGSVAGELAVRTAQTHGLDVTVLRQETIFLSLMVVGMLGAGVVTASFRGRGALTVWTTRWRWGLAAAVLGPAIVLVSACTTGYAGTLGHVRLLDPLLAAGVVGLLCACSTPQGSRLVVALSVRPLRLVGTASYSLYLTHAPVLQAVWLLYVRPLHVSPGVGLLVLLVLGTPLSLLVAEVFHRLVEAPSRSRAARAGKRPLHVVAPRSSRRRPGHAPRRPVAGAGLGRVHGEHLPS